MLFLDEIQVVLGRPDSGKQRRIYDCDHFVQYSILFRDTFQQVT